MPTSDTTLIATSTESSDASSPTQAETTVDLRGVRFAKLTEDQAIDRVLDALDDGRGGWVITSNLDHLLRAGRDEGFRAMLDEADFVVADGAPLVWASRLQGTPLPERVAGSSMVSTLSERAAERVRSIFLLGGDPGAADAAAEVLRQRYSDIKIVGTHCPPYGFESQPDEMQAIRDALTASRPDLVYVALGSPKQERLIQSIRDTLPQAWWMGVGISLSFLSGQVRRAPVWMQKTGLEWLHRVAQEPRRLFKRYFVDGIPFAVRLLAGSFLIGRRNRDR
jgi:N-acetylglucosaminyldiphosphoundecaprenol N-acetyl-beta-D-mannosaminyltransferase